LRSRRLERVGGEGDGDGTKLGREEEHFRFLFTLPLIISVDNGEGRREV